MPYHIAERGPEPAAPILRRKDVLRWLTIRPMDFDRVFKAHLLPWKKLKPDGYRYFLKADIKRIFLNNYRRQ